MKRFALGMILIVGFIGGVLFEPQIAIAQTDTTGSISGVVVNSDGSGVDLTMEILHNGDHVAWTHSAPESAGLFSFPHLAPGTYEIRTLDQGLAIGHYQMQRIKSLKVVAGKLSFIKISLADGDGLQTILTPQEKIIPAEP